MTREEWAAIQARHELSHYADCCIADQERWNAVRADRRALLALVRDLAAAAGKVECANCASVHQGIARGPCPDCAPLRELLEVVR